MDFLLFNFFLFTLLIFCAFVAFSQWRQSRETAILWYVFYLLGAFGHYLPDFWRKGHQKGFFSMHPDLPLNWDTPMSYANLACYFLFFKGIMGIGEHSERLEKWVTRVAHFFFLILIAQLLVQAIWDKPTAETFHVFCQVLTWPIMIFLTIYLFRRPLVHYQKFILYGVIALDLGFLGNILSRVSTTEYEIVQDAINCFPTKWGNFYFIQLKVAVVLDVLCFSWALTLWQKKLLADKAEKVAPVIQKVVVEPLAAAPVDDEFLQKIHAFLAKNFADEKLSVHEIARAVALSEGQTARKLKEKTGRTTEQFLLRFRLDRSLEMLRSPELSIKQITTAVGLEDAAHFSKVFKKEFGQSPTEMRRIWREKAV